MAKNYEAHPLFPAKADADEPAEVVTIQVFRVENMQKMMIPRRFMASELQDEMVIFEQYGGGVYELVARNDRHITDRRALTLPGPSKPLFDAPPAAAVAPAASFAQQSAPGTPSWLPLIATLLPVFMQWMSGNQQMQRDSQQQMTALMTNMMKQSQDSNTQMVAMLTTMNRPQAGAQGADFKEGMNFMQDILTAQLEKAQGEKDAGNESDDIMKTIQAAMQGIEMLNMFKGQTDNAPPIAPPNGAA